MTTSVSAWTAPGFRRLATAWVFTNLGDSALYLMVAVWVKDLTGSDVAAAFVFVALGIPAVLAPFLGMLADRFSRKRLLILANVLMVPVVLSLWFMTDADTVWVSYVVILLYGSCGYLTGAAQSGIIRGMLRDEQLASGNGALSTTENGLRLLSPLIGTVLYVGLGPHAVVVLTAACFAVTTVILRGLPVPDASAKRGASRGYLRELVGGILSARFVRALGEPCTAALGMGFLAVGSVPLVFGSLAVAAGGMAVMGFGIPLTVVAFATLRQRLTPHDLQGRAAAAGNVAINLPQTLVSILGAALIASVDYRVLFWVTVGVVAAGGMLALAARAPRPAPAAA